MQRRILQLMLILMLTVVVSALLSIGSIAAVRTYNLVQSQRVPEHTSPTPAPSPQPSTSPSRTWTLIIPPPFGTINLLPLGGVARYSEVQLTVLEMTVRGTIPAGGIILNGLSWNTEANKELFVSTNIEATGAIRLNENGAVTFTLRVPRNTPLGRNTIEVRDSGNQRAVSSLEVVNPIIRFSPIHAVPNSTIVIEGSGWVPVQSVEVVFRAGAQLATHTAVPTNEGTFSFKFIVPLGWTYVSNTIGIEAADFVGNSWPLTNLSVLNPHLVILPESGVKGQEVVVSLTNTAANAPVSAITFDDFPATLPDPTPLTDNTGNASIMVKVPTALNTIGNLYVVATVGLPPSHVATNNIFTLTKPTITLNPSEQARTGPVTITGKGWVPDKKVTINIKSGENTVATFDVVPDAAGNFTAAFTVSTDLAPDSLNNVIATDTQNNTAETVTLKVLAAAITVTPTQVSVDQTVTIKGTGFNGGSQVQYGFPWAGVGALTGFSPAVYTDAAGNFTASFIIPTVTKGVRSLGANTGGAAGVSATTTIEVTEAPPTVASALAPIVAQLVRVWAFDGAPQTWKLYDPSVPAELNTLTTLNKGVGFFINVKAATTLVTGSGNTVSLSPGWNPILW